MKLLFGCAIALLSAITPAAIAQNAHLVNEIRPGDPMKVDEVLLLLEKRGDSLGSFVSDVKLKEENDDLATEFTRTGKIWYQKLPDGTVRFRISFTNREDEKGKRVEQRDYILDRGWLTERDYDKKIQIRRQILRPGQQINPIKLGEGPFPLPIGQKKEDVEREFETKTLKPIKDEPKGTTHLVLKPKDGSSIKQQGFSMIDVFVDPVSQMPVRIDSVKGKKSMVTELEKIQINPQLTDKEFELPPVRDMKGWTVREEPMER